MGEFVNSKAASANYGEKAVEARTNGLVRRKQAYATAYGLENDSAQSAYIAGRQMQAMRQNQTAAVADARVQNASSGFSASTGSKLRQEMSTAQIFEEAIANAGLSYAIQDQNARNQANQLRKEGDDAARMGDVTAHYYSRASKVNSIAGNWQLFGGSMKTIGDTFIKYDEPISKWIDNLFSSKPNK